MILVVMGHRRKGESPKEEWGRFSGSRPLHSWTIYLLSQGLIYSDPSREVNFWRPTQSTLLGLGFRSYTDIPALKELEEWFETQKEIPAIAKLDPFFEKSQRLASRRLKREIERRGTLGEPLPGAGLST